jgi:hypothetical protein
LKCPLFRSLQSRLKSGRVYNVMVASLLARTADVAISIDIHQVSSSKRSVFSRFSPSNGESTPPANQRRNLDETIMPFDNVVHHTQA